MDIPGSPFHVILMEPRRDYRDPLLPTTGSTERPPLSLVLSMDWNLHAPYLRDMMELLS